MYQASNYIVSSKHGSVAIRCIGCGQPIPVMQSLQIRIVEGYGAVTIDPRPKTPTGGRFGLPADPTRRRFPQTRTGAGCVRCSLQPGVTTLLPQSARGKRR